MNRGAPLRVAIWGVYGRGNFGNEATLAALLQRLDPQRYAPVLFTEDPAEASRIHGVPAHRIGRPVDGGSGSRAARILRAGVNRVRFLASAIRRVAGVDAVAIGGTGPLEQYGSGSFGTPYEIWCLGVASRLLRRPFLLLDIGVGVLPGAAGRFFVRGIARAATYRSYRDEASRESMRSNGARGTGSDAVVADMAFALEPALSPSREPDLVVVGLMDYWGADSRFDATAEHASYRERCVRLVDDLTARGYQVVLVGGDDVDLDFAHAIAPETAAGVRVVDARTPDELAATMSAAAAVVATRFHTLVFALLALTPVVSIGYDRKHLSVLEQFDLGGSHFATESFDPAAVVGRVDEVIADTTVLREKMIRGVSDARGRLDEQWPRIARALTGRRGDA